MISRKQPGLAFWATVVVVVGLAYPLSLGPAWWLWAHRVPVSRAAKYQAVLETVYSPLGLLLDHSETIQNTCDAYVKLWVSDDEMMEHWWAIERERWDLEHPVSP